MQYTTTLPQVKPLYRATQLVWYIVGIIEVVLFFRFILRLVAASTQAGFTNFIYALSAPFYEPFRSMVSPSTIDPAHGVFDWNAVVAMLAYWLLATIIVRLVLIGKPVSTIEAHQRLNEEEQEI